MLVPLDAFTIRLLADLSRVATVVWKCSVAVCCRRPAVSAADSAERPRVFNHVDRTPPFRVSRTSRIVIRFTRRVAS
jgi:hypothetical protein